MTKKTEPNLPRDLLRNLIPIAEEYYFMYGSNKHPHARANLPYGKPGEFYLKWVGPAGRHIMKGLKSEDNYDDRWPPYDNTDSSNRKK